MVARRVGIDHLGAGAAGGAVAAEAGGRVVGEVVVVAGVHPVVVAVVDVGWTRRAVRTLAAAWVAQGDFNATSTFEVSDEICQGTCPLFENEDER